LRHGHTLANVTAEIRSALGVRAQVVPMSNDSVRTRVCTPSGELEFQTYFVKRRARDSVSGVRFAGAERANPAPGVLEAIAHAEAIILCPSNPFISIGPILAIPGIREALRQRRQRIAAISPIVGGRALKGPAARMMRGMSLTPSAAEVARQYADFVGVFVVDQIDSKESPCVDALGMRPVVTNTVMSGLRERRALARQVVRALEIET